MADQTWWIEGVELKSHFSPSYLVHFSFFVSFNAANICTLSVEVNLLIVSPHFSCGMTFYWSADPGAVKILQNPRHEYRRSTTHPLQEISRRKKKNDV